MREETFHDASVPLKLVDKAEMERMTEKIRNPIPWGNFPFGNANYEGAVCPHCGSRQYPKVPMGDTANCDRCDGVYRNPRYPAPKEA